MTQPSTSGQNDNKKRKTSPSPSDIQAVNRLAPDYLPDATVSEAYKRGLDKFNKLDNQVDYLFDYFENQQKKGLTLVIKESITKNSQKFMNKADGYLKNLAKVK